ncbi:DUF2092 domain-containing protein [Phenylobacterium terrae]|uniref:DUF2092 domain-containing protein n=1 Tax=Phenylobacterium terrae TaxID=2665495 RepID=A0ABW4N2S6_9CAUL
MRPVSLALIACLGAGLAGDLAAQTRPDSTRAEVAPAVEPEALQALQRMSAYLGTFSNFTVEIDADIDVVMDDGERVQLDEQVVYKVRRPTGMVVQTSSPRRERHVIYDGKQLTVYAPRQGYYATVDAPPTIRETLDAVADQYGITLPLVDLLRWSEPDSYRPSMLKAGYHVGPAIVEGVETDHYAFREGDLDWQIWIEKGDKPVPRKVVIVDNIDEARPAYVGRLTWNAAPQFTAQDFAFKPGKDAKAIVLVTFEP